MNISNLRDLVNKDLSRELPKNRELSKKYLGKAKASLGREIHYADYYVDQLESALRYYEAAFRADTSNNEAMQEFELFKNYEAGVKTLLNELTQSSLAVGYFEKVVSTDPSFRSAMNLLMTAAVLADDWETISKVGILTGSDERPRSLEYLESLEDGGRLPDFWPRNFRIEHRDWKNHPELYAYLKQRGGQFVETLPKKFKRSLEKSFYEPGVFPNNTVTHATISRNNWNHWLEVWLVGDDKTPDSREICRPYKTVSQETSSILSPLRGKHIGECSITKPRRRPSNFWSFNAFSRIAKYFSTYQADLYHLEKTFPVLVTIWEIPFYMESRTHFEWYEYVHNYGLIQNLLDYPCKIGYTGEVRYRTGWGKVQILCTPNSPVVDCWLDDPRLKFHHVQAEWYCE